MKKIVAMIPSRLNSKRVFKKNLRLIDGKPLVNYIIEKVKRIKIFDEIYLNSESDIFNKIAIENGIKFYLFSWPYHFFWINQFYKIFIAD